MTVAATLLRTMRHLSLFVSLLLPTTGAGAQTLLALDSSRALSRLDAQTGRKVVFGAVSSSTVITAELAYDPGTATVFVSSTANDRLYRLDVNTGAATLIGPYGDDSVVMHGLEYDTSTGTLYGASGGGTNDNIYAIDQTTGAAVQVGNTGLTGYTNLGYDPFADVLYASNANSDSLYAIDRHSGAATLIGPLNGPVNPSSLAVHPMTGVLYLIDNDTDGLYTVDTTTGAATLVGSTGAGNLLGLAFVPPTGTYAVDAAGCVGALGVPGNVGLAAPSCGRSMQVQFTGLPFDAAIWVVGLSDTVSAFGPLPLDLGALGAPGCTARVSTDLTGFVAGAPGSGSAVLGLAIPDLPTVFPGLRLYTQALVFDLGNPLGIVTSDAAAAVVGI